MEIPKFSGVVSDFISSVITLPEKKGPFYQLAQDFEKELIKGEIVVRTLDEYLYPEIKYNFQDTEIPLHRSSSTVSELAPLFLYLKYSIQPKSVLIIEEPDENAIVAPVCRQAGNFLKPVLERSEGLVRINAIRRKPG